MASHCRHLQGARRRSYQRSRSRPPSTTAAPGRALPIARDAAEATRRIGLSAGQEGRGAHARS
eukprot:358069-Chlamydomonas_euryale.AAC.2